MGADDRVNDLIHFIDIYVRKSNMIKTIETVKKTDKEIMDKINKMYAIEEAKQETRKNAGRHSHGHHHHEEEKDGGEHKHDDGHVHE